MLDYASLIQPTGLTLSDYASLIRPTGLGRMVKTSTYGTYRAFILRSLGQGHSWFQKDPFLPMLVVVKRLSKLRRRTPIL